MVARLLLLMRSRKNGQLKDRVTLQVIFFEKSETVVEAVRTRRKDKGDGEGSIINFKHCMWKDCDACQLISDPAIAAKPRPFWSHVFLLQINPPRITESGSTHVVAYEKATYGVQVVLGRLLPLLWSEIAYVAIRWSHAFLVESNSRQRGCRQVPRLPRQKEGQRLRVTKLCERLCVYVTKLCV